MLVLLLLGLHAALAPFKSKQLNVLQLAMLASLVFTFYVGVLSSIEGVPAAAASVLQHVAVLLDAGVAVTLLGALLWRARLVFDYDGDGKVSWLDVKHTFARICSHGTAVPAAVRSIVTWLAGSFAACSPAARGK
jgi:hypothetical protein